MTMNTDRTAPWNDSERGSVVSRGTQFHSRGTQFHGGVVFAEYNVTTCDLAIVGISGLRGYVEARRS